MTSPADVASHYSNGGLLAAIESGLSEMGSSLAAASIDDLAPVDEFHIGGRSATAELCEQLGVQAESNVLDLGAGIGGTARFVGSSFGCSVTGIDITPEYVDVARAICAAIVPEASMTFQTGDATDMAFPDAAFDIATQLHVGMNIADKGALFAEVHRVLRPGGRYGIYDIMRLSDDPHDYPVPWASTSEISFVETPAEYTRLLESAGFRIISHRGRGQYAQDFFATARRNAEAGAPRAPVGLHLILGDDAPVKIGNMVAAVNAGTLAPTEIICERLP